MTELKIFLARIEAHSGQKAILYMTREFDDRYRISSAIERPLWLRSLIFAPNFGSRPWMMWQVSNFRRLDGISGRVDWNVSRLDLDRVAPALREVRE